MKFIIVVLYLILFCPLAFSGLAPCQARTTNVYLNSGACIDLCRRMGKRSGSCDFGICVCR
ncbi:unnamed protein product [Cylicocyclus nassatus]|uniref:Uncharacterized protein n=1 Tax=Cylicocyclus nassatus TaxID=53992 RepID=A0AA36M0M7_CYLNA|nr:unnamed protein product [Cylicocyclus nassatus]